MAVNWVDYRADEGSKPMLRARGLVETSHGTGTFITPLVAAGIVIIVIG